MGARTERNCEHVHQPHFKKEIRHLRKSDLKADKTDSKLKWDLQVLLHAVDAEVSVVAVVVIAVAAAEAEEVSAEEVAAAVVVTVAVAVEEGELQEVAEVQEVVVEAAEEVEVAPKLSLLNLIATTECLLHVEKKMLLLP